MQITGIIAEYNPFHTGHEYHLRQARLQTGADYLVVVMSPDFVQRGEPALFDKYIRTEMALRCGADLVLELPVCYATGSAEYFAEGSSALLDKIGADYLCFGAENPDPHLFWQTAHILADEPSRYRQILRENLKNGAAFPAARAEALQKYTGETAAYVDSDTKLADFLAAPNNILGIEYCKALLSRSSQIRPFPILRKESRYHHTALEGIFCSASAIRANLTGTISQSPVREILQYIPQSCQSLFLTACQKPLTGEDLTAVLIFRLLQDTGAVPYEHILDISSDLAERIMNLRYDCIGRSFPEIVTMLKTRNLTESRVRRALLHLVLDIRTARVEQYRSAGTVSYGRVLGFRKSAAPLLHELKKRSRIPLLTKLAHAPKILDSAGMEMLHQDIHASHIYRSLLAQKYNTDFRTEYQYPPVILTNS